MHDGTTRSNSPLQLVRPQEKKEEIAKQIREEETEKAKIQAALQVLTKRMAQLNDSLARKACISRTVRTNVCSGALPTCNLCKGPVAT